MAQAPVKRRIQPQLISPLVGASANNAFAVPVLGQAGSHPAPTQDDAFSYIIPGLKEDAEYSSQNGMKGRRMIVTLDRPSKDVNYKKVSMPNLGRPCLQGLQSFWLRGGLISTYCSDRVSHICIG